MLVYVLEYYGGAYSDSWTAIKGVFSSPEKAMEWCRANPNKDGYYSDEESFNLYPLELDNPDFVFDEDEACIWFHRPEIVPGVFVRVVGYAPNSKPERQAYLHQVGTVVARSSRQADIRFGESKRLWPWALAYLEEVTDANA